VPIYVLSKAMIFLKSKTNLKPPSLLSSPLAPILQKSSIVSEKDTAKPDFLAKSPAGKLPVLDTPRGSLFESNAIARYVAKIRRDTELTGATFFESSQVDAWMDFCAHEVELPAHMWTFTIMGLIDNDSAIVEKASADLHKALAVLEKHLLLRTYVVGEAITLADIVLVCALYYPYKLVLDAEARDAYPSVTRWYTTCANQPQFIATLGPVVLADSVTTVGSVSAGAAAPKGANPPAAGGKGGKGPAAAGAGAPKEKAPKEEKPKAAAAPKEEKPKKKKEEDEDDGGDDDMPKEPKKADPFAALPPSPMVLDEWKRTYSNSRSEGYYPSMAWFWANLDREGYSVWINKYKYNEENKVDWQTSNLIGGFIQRCDEVRKYAFGSMAVLGNSAPFEVSGAWVIRGKDIKPMLEANPDAEYYDWVAVNPDDEASRKLVADYWCATESLLGKPIYDSKIFK
jgi:elongation factor 1-gamma